MSRRTWVIASVPLILSVILAAAVLSRPQSPPGILPGEIYTDHEGSGPWVVHGSNELICLNGARVKLLSGGRLIESPSKFPVDGRYPTFAPSDFPIYLMTDGTETMFVRVRDGAMFYPRSN